MTRRPSVTCEKHGEQAYCLICRHLRDETGLRYVATPACKHGPAQAWCSKCDAVVESERGWTDRSDTYADFNLFCAKCYKDTLRQHEFVEYIMGSDDPCDWPNMGPPDE